MSLTVLTHIQDDASSLPGPTILASIHDFWT